MADKVAIFNPLRPTRRPDWFGKCYYLCKSCRGSGDRPVSGKEEPKPKVKDEGKTKQLREPVRKAVAREKDCPVCGGLGMVLR